MRQNLNKTENSEKKSDLEESLKNTQISSLIKESLEIIESEYAHIFGVEELAERLGVTKFHLIRTLKKSGNKSPGKILNETRIKKSLDLLSTTGYNLESVANIVGFANANYFCKVFRQVMSMSPGEFRSNFTESKRCTEKLDNSIYF